jgi:hypothetical protein
MTEQALRIPLAQIEEHPDYRLRFEYRHTDELAQSFIETAKADWEAGDQDSNGQQQPGRAVLSKDGKNWELYIGLRRRLAMMKAYELTGDKRFSYLWLYDDTGITREEMLRRVLEDRPEIRENLTLLEEVRIVRLFNDIDFKKIATKDQQERFERLRRVAEAFGDEELANLHKIETRVGFTFKLQGLEFLSGIQAGPERYKTAAEMAAWRYDQSKAKMADAQKLMDEALGFDWFKQLFPSLAEAQSTGGAEDERFKQIAMGVLASAQGQGTGPVGAAGTGARIDSGSPGAETEEPTKPPPGAEGNVLTAACPYCAGPVLVKPEEIKFDLYKFSVGNKTATLMAAEVKAGEWPDSCELCDKPIFIHLKEEKRVSEDSKEQRVWKVGVTKRLTEIAEAADRHPSEVFILWNDDHNRWDVVDSAGNVVRRFDVSEKSRGRKRKK